MAEGYTRTYAHHVREAGRVEEFLRSLIRGVMEGLNEVEEETAKRILRRCGENCLKLFLEIHGLDLASYDLDSLVAKLDEGITTTGNRCERRGDTIIYEFKPKRCECPLVSENIVKLTPRLCSTCFTNGLEYLFGAVSKRAVKAELIESLATGADKCSFKIKLSSE